MDLDRTCDYGRAEKEAHVLYKLTMGIEETFTDAQLRFETLAMNLFKGEEREYFSKAIPEDFHPGNVRKKADENLPIIWAATPVYEEAIRIYEKALEDYQLLMQREEQ
jgi:hypothetical protein